MARLYIAIQSLRQGCVNSVSTQWQFYKKLSGSVKALEEQAHSAVQVCFSPGMKRDTAGYKGAVHFSMSVGSISLSRSCQLGTDFSF
ncbi:hypothetical protein NIES4073_44190 [Kalymmatonema gypsitolerans NIES-4073]|jgi:hypothetical protein|nr:hypothetical protein NIES4073_44190 [Scytonema sp. NIES-4073]